MYVYNDEPAHYLGGDGRLQSVFAVRGKTSRGEELCYEMLLDIGQQIGWDYECCDAVVMEYGCNLHCQRLCSWNFFREFEYLVNSDFERFWLFVLSSGPKNPGPRAPTV